MLDKKSFLLQTIACTALHCTALHCADALCVWQTAASVVYYSSLYIPAAVQCSAV
jgi:hypothetical protein